MAETPRQDFSEALPMEVGHFFATPVIVAMLPDADARNRELREAILRHRAETPSRDASNLGGWHSDSNTEQWGGPRFAEVLAAARSLASRMTLDREGSPAQVNWKIRAWANVNTYGHANEFHYHPGAFWSGAYYVDDGGRLADDSLGGEFELMDPRGPGVAMYAPSLVIKDGSANSSGSTVQFNPRPGLIMLFPSWLQHQVRPYWGSSERISIAFNLSQ